MIDGSAFVHSSVADLSSVASALRSSRLGPPFPPVVLTRLVDPSQAGQVSQSLKGWTDRGYSPQQIADVLELLIADRQRQSPGPVLDLVTTGPETTAVCSRDTAVVVRDLFQSATKCVLLAGFAVHQGRSVFQTLAERMNQLPDLRVRFFLDVRREHGDTTPDAVLVSQFAHDFWSRQWPESARRPDVHYFPAALHLGYKRAYLHAKCVVIDEERVFVTSANFTEAAQERNIEVGVVFRDQSVALQLSHHFESLASSGSLHQIS